MRLRFASVLVLAIAFSGCGSGGKTAAIPTPKAPAGCTAVAKPKPRPDGTFKKPSLKLDASKTWTATVTTNCGTFAFRLDVKDAPHASASIAYLAGRKFYDGTIFHRI